MSGIKTADDLLRDANSGIVGINDELLVYEGYDGYYPEANPSRDCPEWKEPENWRPMSKEEKHRLADLMIARWRRYKEAAE